MKREEIIKDTLNTLQQLPDDKIGKVKAYSALLLSEVEDRILTEGIRLLAADSGSYDFLNEDEDLYTVEDLKEVYHAKS